jgi:two-component system, LytTR family, sensor histidine kinase LytS
LIPENFDRIITGWKHTNPLLYHRWLWHALFWVGYCLFRLWPYYITVTYYNKAFLEYMLLSEVFFVAVTYLTLYLYRRLFAKRRYLVYFITGTIAWIGYLYARTQFQFNYLQNEPAFQRNTFFDIFINNITVVIVFFLFITACKYCKDGYIAQQFDAERKQQQLMAEVNNLKSQIAPHFLFNTLNNLYGLAVDRSDKLPGLMLQLSDLLRHSLYETQKPLVNIYGEIKVLKSYIELESVRLEDDLKLSFDNKIPPGTTYCIAPLILIVFVENAFKHSRLVQGQPVEIAITTALENGQFTMGVKNNYNQQDAGSAAGIGLANVKRRLDVLYPYPRHQLSIGRDDVYFTINLQLQLYNGDPA